MNIRNGLLALPSSRKLCFETLEEGLQQIRIQKTTSVVDCVRSLQKTSVELMIIDEEICADERVLDLLRSDRRPNHVIILCDKKNISIWEARIPDVIDEYFKNPVQAERLLRYIQRQSSAEKQRMLQEQLNRAQRMEAIGTLAGGIAHDFNNILQSIYLYLGMAMDALPPGDIKDDISQVSKAAARAKKLVGQIITFSRTGEQKQSNVLVQLVIKEVLKFLRSTFPSSVKVIEDIDPDCLPVYCDPSQFHQIIMNMCTNSYDALPKKQGTISIKLNMVDLDPEKDQQIQLRKGKYIELIIADDGSGIPPSVMPQIFNPFFSTKGPGLGSGLGLSVVLGIVEEIGGQILAESKKGEGATFRLYFPVVHEIVNSEKYLSGDISVLKHISILLIAKEKNIRRGIQRTLEKDLMRVESCRTPDELLGKLDNSPDQFKILLADIDVPEMTGVQLAEIVKRKYPAIGVVLMTGNKNNMTEISTKVDAVLTKPWKMAELLGTLVHVRLSQIQNIYKSGS